MWGNGWEKREYEDIFRDYTGYMKDVLQKIKPKLREDGFLFLHCNHGESFNLKIILDDIYGVNNFCCQIIVKNKTKNVNVQFETLPSLNAAYDCLLVYRKSNESRFNKIENKDKKNGNEWKNLYSGETRPTMQYELCGINKFKYGKGQWKWSKEKAYKAVWNYKKFLKSNGYTEKDLERIEEIEDRKKKNKAYKELDDKLLLYWNKNKKLEFIRRKYMAKTCYYWKPPGYTYVIDNNWLDIFSYDHKNKIYPTKKSQKLLERIIEISTDESDIVLDCFAGSGVTGIAAQNLNRRYIVGDVSPVAVEIMNDFLKRKEDIYIYNLLRTERDFIDLCDSTEFEKIICGFFAAKHVGGPNNPDGIIEKENVYIEVKNSDKPQKSGLSRFRDLCRERDIKNGYFVAWKIPEAWIKEQREYNEKHGVNIEFVECRDILKSVLIDKESKEEISKLRMAVYDRAA